MIRANFVKRLPLFTLKVGFEADRMTTILWGESGAGKTSILDCIAGVKSPDSGEIELNGRLVFSSVKGIDVPPRERQIGYVFQDYLLFPHLSAEGNVALALPSKEKYKAQEYLERFGLLKLKNRRPGQLSGGERQRLALARALATAPQLLLLDEPFSALDLKTREQTYREFIALRDELGICTILVTHSKTEADMLGQQVIEIREELGPAGEYERVAGSECATAQERA
ncbi:MAG: ATP-binding cassette domain-containing protein [Spirochaetaceae bacterium]|nr:ATP-binding cassette domain-containing protein [Spirochaetaceae bacterium]